MSAYTKRDVVESRAFQDFLDFVEENGRDPVGKARSLEDFERDLRSRSNAVLVHILHLQLQAYDLEADRIEIEGREYRHKTKSAGEYFSQAGMVPVMRSLYVPASGEGRAIAPLELQAGIVEGKWTPLAARVAARSVAYSTPKEASQLLRELGGMEPSTSSLDRLPKKLSEAWEADREELEDELRVLESVPEEAVLVSVSLDGVHAPMKGTGRVETRNQEDKRPRGPAGFREVGCGTVSLYDVRGERLQTIKFARMPEKNKLTLKGQLEAEVKSLFAARPDLKLHLIADGAEDNWSFLNGLALELGIKDPDRVLDIFHVLERLKSATDAYYGEGSSDSKVKFEEYRVWLKECSGGAKKVLRSLRHLRTRSKGHKKKKLEETIQYISRRLELMQYAKLRRKKRPIGSGVVEASCKTLVAERLKRSGMSWGMEGGQAVLTLRSLIQSDRWEAGWAYLASSYKISVIIVNPRKVA